MFHPDLLHQAELLLATARARGVRIVTAESCTGGLVAGLLTEIPGSSDVVDRGFVTYSNHAKAEALGVPVALLKAHGAVSEPVAVAMVEGALMHAHANLAIAVTGIAGPGGGLPGKPVGLVHMAAALRGQAPVHEVHHFGGIGRTPVRLATVSAALALMQSQLGPA